MEDCIFCRIVKGEIPADKLYDDEGVIAILDINPFSLGHILVIPKNHEKWVWDMNDKDYVELMLKTRYLANVLRKAFDVEWVEEVIAGIGVAHVHVHLLPRTENDGLGDLPTKPIHPRPSKEEMSEIADRIRAYLK